MLRYTLGFFGFLVYLFCVGASLRCESVFGIEQRPVDAAPVCFLEREM